MVSGIFRTTELMRAVELTSLWLIFLMYKDLYLTELISSPVEMTTANESRNWRRLRSWMIYVVPDICWMIYVVPDICCPLYHSMIYVEWYMLIYVVRKCWHFRSVAFEQSTTTQIHWAFSVSCRLPVTLSLVQFGELSPPCYTKSCAIRWVVASLLH